MELKVIPNGPDGRWLEWKGQPPGVPIERWWAPTKPERSREKVMEWLGLNPDGTPSTDPEVRGQAALDVSSVPCVLHGIVKVTGSLTRPSGYISRRPPSGISLHPTYRYEHGVVKELEFSPVGPGEWEAPVDIWIDSPASKGEGEEALAHFDVVVWDREGREFKTDTLKFRIVYSKIVPGIYEDSNDKVINFVLDLLKSNYQPMLESLIPPEGKGYRDFIKAMMGEATTTIGGETKPVQPPSIPKRKALIEQFPTWLDRNWTKIYGWVANVMSPFVLTKTDRWSSYFEYYNEIADKVRTLILPSILGTYISDACYALDSETHPPSSILERIFWKTIYGEPTLAAPGEPGQRLPISALSTDETTKGLYEALYKATGYFDARSPAYVYVAYAPDAPYAIDGKIYWYHGLDGRIYVLTQDGPQPVDYPGGPVIRDLDVVADILQRIGGRSQPRETEELEEKPAPAWAEWTESHESVISAIIAKLDNLSYILEHYPESVNCDKLSEYMRGEQVFSYLTGANLPPTKQLSRLRSSVGRLISIWESKCESKFEACSEIIDMAKMPKDPREMSLDELRGLYLLLLGCQEYQHTRTEPPLFFRTPFGYGLSKIMRPLGLMSVFTIPAGKYLAARDPIWRLVFTEVVELDNGELAKVSDLQSRLTEIATKAAVGQQLSEDEMDLVWNVYNSEQAKEEFKSAIWQLSESILMKLGKIDRIDIGYDPRNDALNLIASKIGSVDERKLVELTMRMLESKFKDFYVTPGFLKATEDQIKTNWATFLASILSETFSETVLSSKEGTVAERMAKFSELLSDLDEEDIAKILASSARVSYVADLDSLVYDATQVVDRVIDSLKEQLKTKGQVLYQLPNELASAAGIPEERSRINLSAKESENLPQLLEDVRAKLISALHSGILNMDIPQDISPYLPSDVNKLPDWGKQTPREVERALGSCFRQLVNSVIREVKNELGAYSPWDVDRVLELLKYQLIGWTFFPTFDPKRRFGGSPFFPFVGEYAHMGQRILVRSVLTFSGLSYSALRSLIGR